VIDQMRRQIPILVLIVFGLVVGHPAHGGEDESSKGLDRFVDVLLDVKDLSPAGRILPLLSEAAITFDPAITGTAYVRDRLHLIFTAQLNRARERQADTPFRDPNFKHIPFYLDEENVDHLLGRLIEEFPSAPKIAREKLIGVFPRIQEREQCFGELVLFYDARHKERPTHLLVVIINRQGQIILIDEP
jgi:hypothetical protein